MVAERDPKNFAGPFELDYFRRARSLRRLKWWLSVAAFFVALVVVAAAIARPSWHSAFQAAPVSQSHQQFADNCAACHDRPFAAALRFIPGLSGVSVSDAKCLECHDAGRHSPYQLHHIGDSGQAAGCVECHKEHRGDKLAQFTDVVCTSCHADLQTNNSTRHVASAIRHFADGHPEFGNWRKAPLSDPAAGKFHFNHQRHLKLAQEYSAVSLKGREAIVHEFEQMRRLQCVYCHQTDADGRRMMPIRFDTHCAVCHPLAVHPVPVGGMSAENTKAFSSPPLHHPGPGDNAASIRAQLLERYLRAAFQTRAVDSTVINPPILGSAGDTKAISERERLALARTRETEKQLFDNRSSGCQLCHVETGRKDDVPEFAPTHQQNGRWKNIVNNWPSDRFRSAACIDAANRWFPLANFDHAQHRMMACTDCHGNATVSESTADLLMPSKSQCLGCHHQGADAARSNCLTCHDYHDRSQQRPIQLKTPDSVNRSFKNVPDQAKP